jgi:hypothetical protein
MALYRTSLGFSNQTGDIDVVDHKKANSHEQEHANRHEASFRITARRNKLTGLWAAEKFGLDGAAAEAYAKEVVTADLDEPGDADVIRKLLGDFKDKGIAMSEETITETLERMENEARQQLK